MSEAKGMLKTCDRRVGSGAMILVLYCARNAVKSIGNF